MYFVREGFFVYDHLNLEKKDFPHAVSLNFFISQIYTFSYAMSVVMNLYYSLGTPL